MASDMPSSIRRFRLARTSGPKGHGVGKESGSGRRGKPASEMGRATGPACDRCRGLKKKCSRTFPMCQLCATSGRECKYTAVAPDRVEVQQLRAQVERLSKIINNSNSNSNDNYATQPRLSGDDSLPEMMHTPMVAPPASLRRESNMNMSTRPDERGGDDVGQPQGPDVRSGDEGAGAPQQLHVSLDAYPAVAAAAVSVSVSEHSTVVGLLELPALSRRFVDAYFRNVHRAYPFVNRSKILQDLETFGSTPSWRRDPGSTLLYLTMAIGCTTLQRAGQIPEGTASQFDIAYSDIIHVTLGHGKIESLEILVLLALYSLFDPNGMPSWSIVAIAARQAILLGVTRRSSPSDDTSSSAQPVIDSELRHRLFWSVYVLDRMISASLGLPVALTDDNADVPLPGLTLQEFASPDRAGHANMLQTSRHVIQLRQLEDRILQQVHLRKHAEVRAMTPGDRRGIVQDMRASIENWYSSGCLISPQEADNVPIHSSITWLSARYYHLLVLLHYPCNLNNLSGGGYGSVISRLDLLRFAQRHLESTSVLFQQRLLPLNRITLCRMLPIALVLMHGSLWCAAKGVPFPARDEVAVLRSILEAFPEGWTAARQAAYVVRQFLNILTDDIVSGYGPLHISPYGLSQGGDRSQRSVSSSEAALVRPIIASLVHLMYDVLGSSTSLVFLETTPDDSSSDDNAIDGCAGPDVGFAGDLYGSIGITAGASSVAAVSGIPPTNQPGNNDDVSGFGWAGWELDFL